MRFLWPDQFPGEIRGTLRWRDCRSFSLKISKNDGQLIESQSQHVGITFLPEFNLPSGGNVVSLFKWNNYSNHFLFPSSFPAGWQKTMRRWLAKIRRIKR
jgi:hypothetical protein